jgi:hypothetical protein
VWVTNDDGSRNYTPGEVSINASDPSLNYYMVANYTSAESSSGSKYNVTWDEWATILSGSAQAAALAGKYTGIYGAGTAYISTCVALWIAAFLNNY